MAQDGDPAMPGSGGVAVTMAKAARRCAAIVAFVQVPCTKATRSPMAKVPAGAIGAAGRKGVLALR